MEYDRYLLTRENIVTMVSCTVDDLLAEGADSEAITKYLTDETDNIVSTLDPGTPGLYGLFNGVSDGYEAEGKRAVGGDVDRRVEQGLDSVPGHGEDGEAGVADGRVDAENAEIGRGFHR